MLGATHAAAGLSVGLLIASGARYEEAVLLGGVGVLAALLPDIDHPGSYLRRRIGLLGVGFFWLRLRGFTHTMMCAALIAAAAMFTLPEAMALTVMISYASHLLMDAMTVSGAPLLWPLVRRNIRLSPIPIRTGSLFEIVFPALTLLICWRTFIA